MLTIIESPLFTRLWPDYWSADEHGEFAAHLANDPDAGDLIPGSGGCRIVAGQDNIPAHVLRKIAEELNHD